MSKDHTEDYLNIADAINSRYNAEEDMRVEGEKNAINEYIQEKMKDYEGRFNKWLTHMESCQVSWKGGLTVCDRNCKSIHKDFFKRLIEESYKQGVEDSLSKVPKNIWVVLGQISPRHNHTHWRNGYEKCRQQTIDNIKALLNNK